MINVKEKTKIILLRILLSIGIVSIVSIIVVPILCTILPPINQKYYDKVRQAYLDDYKINNAILTLPYDGITELLLMYASRRMLTETKIKPLLKEN